MQRAILLLDANHARRRLHSFGLRCAGFLVAEADIAAQARAHVATRRPDLLLLIARRLDIQRRDALSLLCGPTHDCLPGLAVIERATPADIAMLDALGMEYLTGLPSPDLLVAQVHSVLDRQTQISLATERFVGLRLDRVGGVLRYGEHSVVLGPTELRLLEFLLGHPDQLISRQHLLHCLWGERGEQLGRVVDISICRLRGALRQLHCADHLQTVRRQGYRFVAARARQAPRPPASLPHASTVRTGVRQ